MAIHLPPFYHRHGSEVFFFPGLVREPGITACHIQRAMPQQRLETLDPHPGIEKLAGKGMPKRMQGIPLMGKTGFRDIPLKDKTGCTIGHAFPALSIKKKRFPNISPRKPYLQGVHGILTEINNPTLPVLFSLVNINLAIPEMKLVHLGV
jgi:hypothetical protein